MLSPTSRAIAYAMLVLAALAFSTNFIAAKLIQDSVPPFTLAALRQVVSFLSLVPFLVMGRRAAPPTRPKLLDFLVLGALGIAAPHALMYLALYRTQAINVALVNAALPVMILAAGYLTYRSRPNRAQVAGIAISSIGALAILAHGDPSVLAGLAFNLGDVMALMAIGSVALYTILLARRDVGDQAVPLLAGLTVASALLLAPAAIAEYAVLARWEPTVGTALGILYVGLVPSTVGMLCWNGAVARIGAASAGQAVHLIPAFTAVLAVLMLGERLEGYHVLGFVLVGLGILVVNRGASAGGAGGKA